MRTCEFCRTSTNAGATFAHQFEECDDCFWSAGGYCEDLGYGDCPICDEERARRRIRALNPPLPLVAYQDTRTKEALLLFYACDMTKDELAKKLWDIYHDKEDEQELKRAKV